MKTKLWKRGTSAVLAAVMCFSMIIGSVGTAVNAASGEKDAYMSFNPIKEMTFFLDNDNFFVFRYDFDPRVKELPSEEIMKFETQFYEDFYKLTEMWAERAKEFPAYENPHVEVMLEHTDQYALYRMHTVARA